MKPLILFTFLAAFSVHAQNFSPSASGSQGAGSPSGEAILPASPSTLGTENPSTVGPTNLGIPPTPLGDGSQELLNESNTAPTPIPDDTSLINTPSNDPLKQSQEDTFDPFNSQNLSTPPTGTSGTSSGGTSGSNQ